MLLTIHNLPATTRYADIKSLLQLKCGLQHVILDNLISVGSSKKVTVGVAEDADAAILVRKINGVYWNGMQLYVEDVRQQKAASEQPFRSTNPKLQDTSFHSMNLQQHSSYAKGVPMADNMMTAAVQPMVTAMYYVPDYANSMQVESYGGGFMQTDQGYVQHSETVQSAYMGIGTQSTTQVSQFGMSQNNENHKEFSQAEKRSGWGKDYSKERDFAAEKPIFGQRSPAKSREGNWFTNQQNRRQESPSRDRSQGNREPSWTLRASDNRDPTQPAFRSTVRPTQPDFRSNIRPEEHSGFVKPMSNFRPNDHSGMFEKPARREFQFSGRQSEFFGRPNELDGVPGRQNDRQGRPNEGEGFSRRLNEFSGRSSEHQEPNEFSEKHNNRQGRPNEFSGRPNEFSKRPNEFSGTPNEFSGRPNEFSKRPNEFSGRRSEFSGRPNEFSKRPNPFSGRPNEFSGKPNNRQGRPNEFSERQGRASVRQGRPYDRPGPSRPNDRAGFGHSDGRPDFGWLNERPTFSERGGRSDRGHPKPGLPVSRKRKFEDTRFENRMERPERLSRPDSWRQTPAYNCMPFKGHHAAKKFAPKPFGSFEAKVKPDGVIRSTGGLRYVINDMFLNLGITNPDVITRQMFKKFTTERLEGFDLDNIVLTPQKCFEIYRAKYPRTDDKEAYDTILGLIAQKIADEASGTTVPVETSKSNQDKLITFQQGPKLSKAERKAKIKFQHAKQLMSVGRVPSFPQGDKNKVTQHIKEDKEGYIPEVEAKYKAAIEDEMKFISDILRHELKNAPNETLQQAYNTVLPGDFTDEMQKRLAQGISRRILDSGLKLVRIYAHPKLPKREVLLQFLRPFGAQSMRKSDYSQLYMVSVDTYKNHDTLCAMETVKITDHITLSIKPFYLAPKLKTNQLSFKAIRKKIIADMIDTSDLNLLDKDWPAKKAEIMAKEAEIKAKEVEEQPTLEGKRTDAEKTEQQTDEAEKITTDAEKQIEEALLNNNDVLDEDDDLTGKNDESNKEIDESNEFLNEDFHVIDEINETDSDIEYIGHNDKVVDIDDDNVVEDIDNANDVNGNNDVENKGVEKNIDENSAVRNDVDENNDPENDEELEDNQDNADDEGFDIDDVEADINDMDEDDLEDY